MGFKEGVGHLPCSMLAWPCLLKGQYQTWTWCQCHRQWENVMLCNTLCCVVWHILTDVMWLDMGPWGLALVSISATAGDWHTIQQFRLFSMPYLDSCNMIWHWGWIICHSVMSMIGVLWWPTLYTGEQEHTGSVRHDGGDFTWSPSMCHITLKCFTARPVPWGHLYMFNVPPTWNKV